MSAILTQPCRLLAFSVRLDVLAAIALSLFALAALAGSAAAQQAPLPPVVVEAPSGLPKAKQTPGKKAAAKQAQPAPSLPAPASPPLATALGTYNPALDLPGLVLPPGTTLTTAGPVQGYRALSAVSATKTATPIEQIPQSIQVLPKSLLEDQRSLTVTEALRNVSSAQGINDLNIGNTNLQPLRIRGFAAEQWLDGLVVNYNAGDRDGFANVERVEVLKGPNAILYGGGPGAPVGGAVNIVSKLPTNVPGIEVGSTFGSFGYVHPYFDVNQPISPNVLFRITGEYTSSESYIDVLDQRRYSINPTLTFTDRTNTTLTIQARASRWEQQAYPGLPAVGTVAGDFRIDRNMYAGHPGIIPSYTEVRGITVTFDHKFNSVWSFNVKTRWSQSEFDQNSQGTQTAAPDLAILGPSVWSVINTEVFQRQQEFTINPNVQARFVAGPTRNTVLVGADYSRNKDSGFMNVDFGVPPVDLLNPIFPMPYTRPDPSSPFFFPFYNFDNTYVTKGVYGQVQSSIHNRVHLLAGVRLASIEIDYLERVPYFAAGLLPPELFETDKTKLLPRAGIVVDLVGGLSAYASYSEGMRWAGFNQAQSVAPEESSQREAGLKLKLDHFSGTVAVYEIHRSNIPVVIGVGVAALSEQVGKGFETDLVWQVSRGWQLLASYGYTNAVFADSLSGIPKGNHVPMVPEHSGRVWTNYAFQHDYLRGWSVGAGIYAAGSQYVDTLNLYKTDPYFTVDAKVAYETERFKAALNVKNLTGEEYFLPYPWFGGQVAPGAPRTLYGSVAYRF